MPELSDRYREGWRNIIEPQLYDLRQKGHSLTSSAGDKRICAGLIIVLAMTATELRIHSHFLSGGVLATHRFIIHPKL